MVQKRRAPAKHKHTNTHAMQSNNNKAITDETKDTASRPTPQNAFTALMAPKPKPNDFKDRLGLAIYLSPTPPPNSIIYQTPDFVAIHDKYPKSTIHTLLLPRSHNLLHPFQALQDKTFLKQVQDQVAYLKGLVAKELQRQLGRYSLAERHRQAVLDGECEGAKGVPPGRNWEEEVICGVHAVPSMRHLHVHVLSRDMHGRGMRHRKHYNSFNTGFLVDVMDFPLREGDEVGRGRLLRGELRCWRCGRGFGNEFKRLKEHLEDEFLSWRSL